MTARAFLLVAARMMKAADCDIAVDTAAATAFAFRAGHRRLGSAAGKRHALVAQAAFR